MSQVVEAPVEVEEPTADDVPLDERPWVVIVWNDPINLMSYVTLVLQQLFGYSRAKATKLMLQVHNEGKAAVSTGTREKAELDVLNGIDRADWPKIRQVVVEVHDLDRRVETATRLLMAAGLRSISVEQPPTLKATNIFTIFAARDR